MPLLPLEKTPVPASQPRQAVRVAICGEVNAGKSTLLNALLRAQLLPDNIGQENRPLITARHRDRPGVEALYPGGHRKELAPGEDSACLAGAERVMVWSDAPQIEGFELIELPLTTADEVTEDDLALMRGADVLIWVTIASQAWRLTEKSILGRFGKALPTHGMIVVSRADKLRNEEDRLKLCRRVERETAGLFDGCHFLFGARRTIAASAHSNEDWAKSGAPEILELLQNFSDEIRATDSFRASARNALDAVAEAKLVDLHAFRATEPGSRLRPARAAPELPPSELAPSELAPSELAPSEPDASELKASELTVNPETGLADRSLPELPAEAVTPETGTPMQEAEAPEASTERAVEKLLATQLDAPGAPDGAAAFDALAEAFDDDLADLAPAPADALAMPMIVMAQDATDDAAPSDLDEALPEESPADDTPWVEVPSFDAPSLDTPALDGPSFEAPPVAAAPALPELDELEKEEDDFDAPMDLPDPALLDILRKIAGSLPRGAVAGLLSEGMSEFDPGTCTVLAGDDRRGREAGRACRGLLERLRGAYGVSGLGTRTPEVISLSGKEVQIGLAALPGLGTLFVLADGGQLNSGLVQNLLLRMGRAVEAQ